ncbi:enoyl-CoA hydratase/isomerase family protein [Mesorhizobium sp. BR1-1-9]|uniref:enoyl-CoA hydratase/isomerase family protein n=1 Tax=unclassified Mesorhizobium TaxID=325217 RepID=UPI00112C32AB|nr:MULTISPECIES: enoyl-CoA hydratase/isomerase family protein [unclassified Mesorhizobium]MBZ9808391.1 enoyl-CoA hydratase/isomerase family protein [Mesorhizobium sp. ESP-6-2]MBZ9872516.1 enoyl-CoA hydratase/isomerase family protein [Mesorhizobium sp. BR1-1-9]MBZ9941278.1 enoyl-CoA hydratase/isomerase family protein [Mesorhizobium sp. BR1-1-13]TPM33471.1 enoyl-CoA hydratase/isomerase family protein [Mesorhizobium sp. B2-2-2]
MDFGGGDEIRFEHLGRAGIVTLTRPRALNAVTHRMVNALAKALHAWERDWGVDAVVVKAEGRAFSAGGDILHIYEAGRAGKPPVEFFADEYRLNAQIARFKKPYVALIDGIVMGGGVGISFHGSHRVMTENAQFAMPEVGIGFFPDVGASHLLPDLGGSFGMYLALTGNRIRYGDALWSGLATHTIKAQDQAGFLDQFAATGDPESVLRGFFIPAKRETDRQVLEAIAHHFAQDSLADIIGSLEQAAGSDEFAARTLATILTRSPTSLRVAWRQITAGLTLPMDQCMKMEFRILNRMLAGHDFYEGIRATIIEKGSKPQWLPATLDAVDDADVDAYFASLGERELAL